MYLHITWTYLVDILCISRGVYYKLTFQQQRQPRWNQFYVRNLRTAEDQVRQPREFILPWIFVILPNKLRELKLIQRFHAYILKPAGEALSEMSCEISLSQLSSPYNYAPSSPCNLCDLPKHGGGRGKANLKRCPREFHIYNRGRAQNIQRHETWSLFFDLTKKSSISQPHFE